MARLANVFVRKGKAHVPTFGQIAEGPYVIVEPVHTVTLDAGELTTALEKAVTAGHPLVPTPTRQDTEQRAKGKSPLLRAAGVRSWQELARDGVAYSVEWLDDEIIVGASRRDAQGRFADDPSSSKVFPKGAPLRAIAEAILEDVRSRPELGVSPEHDR